MPLAKISKNRMSELKNKTDNDLAKMLRDRQEALKNFRFNIAGSKTRNVKEGRALRKEIAQTLTEINARSKK